MTKAHLITVLGRKIPVRSSASEEKVRNIETFVNSRIEKLGERLTSADPQLLITLAFLNLAESYIDLQAKQEGTTDINAKVSDIIERLEKAI